MTRWLKFEAGRFYFVLSVIVVGGILGAGSGLMAVKMVSDTESVRNGPWQTSADYGNPDANPWMLSAVALSGLMTTRQDEAVHLTAFRDSAGERLKANCVYYLSGPVPDADWWTVTLYGNDHFPIPNAASIWSASAGDVTQDGQGNIRIQLGGDDPGSAWIPSGAGDAGRSVTLRLYRPAEGVAADLATVALPHIDRGACR